MQRSEDAGCFFALALLYLFFPSAVVLFTFGSWPIAVAIATGLAILWSSNRQVKKMPVVLTHEGRNKRTPECLLTLLLNTWPYLVLAAGAVWLSGVIPPFSENSDWHKHYAIFNTMAYKPWPPKIVTDNGIATLRYFLGYYVIPAIAAKYLGIWVLSVAIFIWTTLGIYIAMMLAFGLRTRKGTTSFLLGCVFLLFSGADIIGTYFTGHIFGPWLHFEWWAEFGQLASSITNLFWAPQHAVSGWLSAFLFFRYPHRAIQNAGVIGAVVAVWSAFSAIGLLPVFLWAILQTGFRGLLTRSNLIAAPILLVSAALFLSKGSVGIPAQFIWDISRFSISVWVVFVFIEFGAISLALIVVTPQKTSLVVIHAAFLLTLCLFSVGAANDLLMRASIPSLGILALLSSTAIAFSPIGIRKVPIIICLVVGLVTPLGEITRALVSPRITNKHEITIIDVIKDKGYLVPQYLVNEN